MRNFLRALKLTWAYRGRLFASVVCAFAAAGLWGLNFTAVYPVLKILSSNLTLQQWIQQRTAATQAEIDQKNVELDKLQVEQKTAAELDKSKLDRPSYKDREMERIAGEIARVQDKLDSASSRLWRYEQANLYFIRFLPDDRFQTLAVLLLMVFTAVVLKGIFEFFQEWLVGSVTSKGLYDLRNLFFRKTVHHDIKTLQDAGTAQVAQLATMDIEVVGNGMKILYGRVIAEPLKIASCVAIASWISWQLTLLFVVLVPVSFLIVTKASRAMKKATRRVLERLSNINKLVQETCHGVRVVKAFTMEPYERRRFREVTRDYYDRSMRVVKIDAMAGPLVEILSVAAVAVALLVGAYLVLNQKTELFGLRMSSHPIDPETLLQLYALLGGMADPVRKLSSVYTKLQASGAAADRVYEAMDRAVTIAPNHVGPRVRPGGRGDRVPERLLLLRQGPGGADERVVLSRGRRDGRRGRGQRVG